MDYRKTHSAPKRVLTQGPELTTLVEGTMRVVADIVGGTLGPGGQPVLIERSDDLPPILTKDGVTVFKSLGFTDPLRQTVLESVRDAVQRTANEAGDGTTTCTILAEAIDRLTRKFCKDNPAYSPHRAVREMTQALKDTVEPTVRKLAQHPKLGSRKGDKVLRQVALISANGDEDLADATMACFEVCGDDGNVTLVEAPGKSRYEVEEIEGYPIPTGYDDGCGVFYNEFLREPGLHRTVLKAPLYILYYGRITEPSKVDEILTTLLSRPGVFGPSLKQGTRPEDPRDVVLVATQFSDSVLGVLAGNFCFRGRGPDGERPVRVFPLRAPSTGIQGSVRAFLDDLAAVTGATVYDDATNPLPCITWEGVGAYGTTETYTTVYDATVENVVWRGRTESVEVQRGRSFLMGYADPGLIELRVEELRAALSGDLSKLEASYLTERVARLSGGIARLIVYGPTNAETKERRDRAEDAVCAVRGAVREGVLYGGCWALCQLAYKLAEADGVRKTPQVNILAAAMLEPFFRLLKNVGIVDPKVVGRTHGEIVGSKSPLIFDALQMKMVDPQEAGVYDSVPAVLEAIRSALSIAGNLGTLGGIVCYARDVEQERQDALALTAHEREVAAGHYQADEVHGDEAV